MHMCMYGARRRRAPLLLLAWRKCMRGWHDAHGPVTAFCACCTRGTSRGSAAACGAAAWPLL